jgi:hypothetical protein
VVDTFPRASLDLATDSKGNILVLWNGRDSLLTTNKLHVERWTGFKWLELGSPVIAEGSGESITVDNADNPLVTWSDGYHLYISRWNRKTWVRVGNQVNTGQITNRPYSCVSLTD